MRPSAAGEPAHSTPPPPRAPGLEAPADLAGRSAPGEVGHDTGPQNRVGIDGALLGTGASACGHAPRLLAPVAPVGARVALDLAPDHRRGPAEHSGDARLAQPRLQPRTDRSTVLHTQRPTTTHTQPLSTRKPAHTLRHHPCPGLVPRERPGAGRGRRPSRGSLCSSLPWSAPRHGRATQRAGSRNFGQPPVRQDVLVARWWARTTHESMPTSQSRPPCSPARAISARWTASSAPSHTQVRWRSHTVCHGP